MPFDHFLQPLDFIRRFEAPLVVLNPADCDRFFIVCAGAQALD